MPTRIVKQCTVAGPNRHVTFALDGRQDYWVHTPGSGWTRFGRSRRVAWEFAGIASGLLTRTRGPRLA